MKFIKTLSISLLIISCSNSGKDEFNVGTSDESDASYPAITEASASLPLNEINLPAGFQIDVYAEVDDARQMALSPTGTLFIGNRSSDNVYAVQDTNGDNKADKKWVVASGLNMPNGVALKDGDLYIAEVSRILRIRDVEKKLNNPGKPEVVYDKLPTETHHGWKYIAFGPDGKLYVPVGAPCNICEPKEIYAAIHRMNADGTGLELFASGIRNTVGFTWHPETKNIWFTDNGRDSMGDELPPCEVNTAPQKGMHFGYPYCHGGTIKDPEFGSKKPCSDFTAPAQNMMPHSAPLGLRFYTGNNFPASYKNKLFVAEHGSWNRSREVGFNGYRVSLLTIDGNKSVAYETFASGWLGSDKLKHWGRPVDVLQLPDGTLLVSDDQAGVVYRISYKG